jgi:2-polyprenyl-3-methyl-5-hydroxy-6-metoxy-1,4-benzoquinol methylase
MDRECPDIVTSSEDYARRFSGRAGEYFLDVQDKAVHLALANGSGRTILDVGGGHGQVAGGLAASGREVVVFGSDNACFERLICDNLSRRCRFVTGDLLKQPFADQSFDVVIALRLISHIEAWAALIRELCRLAEQAVILEYPSLISINAVGPLLFNVKKRIEGNTRTYRSFLPARLGTEFKAHHFDVTAIFPQFFLPMVLHRAMHGARLLQSAEKVFKGLGFTQLLGSPVIMRCDRIRSVTHVV